eukprot:GHUV01053360.1.p2 GENE.GHUV01053360.1~~GHUV01053360.1.p2  ORF type:complete len:127 (-),score=20.11 GHUV01053360.1:915-1295(-)
MPQTSNCQGLQARYERYVAIPAALMKPTSENLPVGEQQLHRQLCCLAAAVVTTILQAYMPLAPHARPYSLAAPILNRAKLCKHQPQSGTAGLQLPSFCCTITSKMLTCRIHRSKGKNRLRHAVLPI